LVSGLPPMIELILDYGLFLAKALTIVVALLVLVAVSITLSRKASDADSLTVENLNQRYRNLANTLKSAALGKSELKALAKSEKENAKATRKKGSQRPKTFVIDFKGDIRASGTDALREEITAIISIAGKDDEVVVRLDNAGGMVHEHGLAASQLVRLRDKNVPLVVAVDKVAASGGYLMACVANEIVAAPFAILGSIGVLAQLPNFNRMLEQHGVDFEQVTAGKYKRSVTMFGKNTDENRAKLREELEDVHELFKSIVSKYRPMLNIDEVATGEHWYGERALELKLADGLSTSDELLTERANDRDIFKVHFKIRHPLKKRLLGTADSMLEWLRQAGAR